MGEWHPLLIAIMTLRRVTYISRVSPAIASVDLRHISGLAEIQHRRRDLSGVLAYTGRHFVQVIEGLTRDVDALLELIRADPRHFDMCILFDDVVPGRQFDRWYSLHVESPGLIEQVEMTYGSEPDLQGRAEDLLRSLVSQLRSDDLMP